MRPEESCERTLRLYEKTGADCQADLVKLVVRFSNPLLD